MTELLTGTFFAILAAGFLVGIVVGLTGMGGGALMTPALIFLGVGEAATVVTADLTAAAVYKTGGAIVHQREGTPNLTLAKWLILGSVPTALLGPYLVSWATDDAEQLDQVLKLCIGFALLFAALTYALRLWINLRRTRAGHHSTREPRIRPIPTVLVGALGGPARRHHQRGLRLGHHDLAADALPRPLGRQAGRHRPGAGRAARARSGAVQHRTPRPRLGRADPAADRLGARHDPRRPARPAGPAVAHPPRHRRGPDHVGGRAPRQGRLGAARRR